MSFTTIPDPCIASLTDAGRNAFARALSGEISFKATSFAVGQSGYQDSDPMLVQPINPGATGLISQFFPVSPGLQPISSFETPYAKTLVINCRLGPNDAVSALGELGVWAEIIYSPSNPAEVGTTFLMALVHTPVSAKTRNKVVVFRVVIQF